MDIHEDNDADALADDSDRFLGDRIGWWSINLHQSGQKHPRI